MDFDSFRASLALADPPDALPPLVAALWRLEKGDWHGAHEIAQSIEGRDAAWVHAHLHRVEGDIWNADYWYRRAGRTRPEIPLVEEWAQIARALLESV